MLLISGPVFVGTVQLIFKLLNVASAIVGASGTPGASVSTSVTVTVTVAVAVNARAFSPPVASDDYDVFIVTFLHWLDRS